MAQLTRVSSISALILGVLFPLLGMADTSHHAPKWLDIAIPTINFLIFAVALYLAVRSPVMNAWSARRFRMKQQLETARTELKRAKAGLDRAQKSLDEAPQMQEQVLRSLRVQTEAEISEMEKKAKSVMQAVRSDIEGRSAVREQQIAKEMYSALVEKIMAELNNKISANFGAKEDHLYTQMQTTKH